MARWRIRLLGDLAPVRGLKNVAIQPDGSVIAEMGQSELIDHFDLLPSLGLELVTVERLNDDERGGAAGRPDAGPDLTAG